MKQHLLAFALIWSLFAWAQHPCDPVDLYQVNASSGMRMRSLPTAESEVVGYVKTKEYVLVCKELSTAATFEEKNGHWRLVRYKDDYGYMFDGFLKKAGAEMMINDSSWDVFNYEEVQKNLDSLDNQENLDAKSAYEAKLDSIIARADSIERYRSDSTYQVKVDTKLREDSIRAYLLQHEKDSVRRVDSIAKLPHKTYQFATETYNYCGSLDNIDPGIRWYGIYYNQQEQKYKIRSIELLVVMSKYSLGSGVEFDIKCEKGISPHFMIGSKDRLDTNLSYDWPLSNFTNRADQIFPGQQMEIPANQNAGPGFNFNLFATGNVTNVGLCPEMTGYHLKLNGEMNGRMIIQDLNTLLGKMGACGMPRLYWYGDLNGDHYPDMIWVAANEEYSSFTLLMSDTKNDKVLVRKAANWTYGKCK